MLLVFAAMKEVPNPANSQINTSLTLKPSTQLIMKVRPIFHPTCQSELHIDFLQISYNPKEIEN